MANITNESFVGIRIPTALKQRIVRLAGSGRKLSYLVRDAIQLYAGFQHPAFINIMEDAAQELGVINSVFIQNVVLRYIAEGNAYRKVFGTDPEVPEFVMTARGIKTGEEIIDEMEAYFIARFIEVKTLREEK